MTFGGGGGARHEKQPTFTCLFGMYVDIHVTSAGPLLYDTFLRFFHTFNVSNNFWYCRRVGRGIGRGRGRGIGRGRGKGLEGEG